MSSLVASYGDSDDSDNTTTFEDEIPNGNGSLIRANEDKTKRSTHKEGGGTRGSVKRELSESESEDSTSSEDEEEEEHDVDNKVRFQGSRNTLDNPFRSFGSSSVSKEESVFQIPFREQEDKKSAVLERHVKMTPTAGAIQMINDKKICWNYRKGKCRFGHNCTFAHDSDINVSDSTRILPSETAHISASTVNDESGDLVKEGGMPSGIPEYSNYVIASAHLSTGNRKPSDNEDGNYMRANDFDSPGNEKHKRKKRSGMPGGLEPSKKVMLAYYKNKVNR